MMKATWILMFGLVGLVRANDEVPAKIEVTKTEHAELAAGGTLRLKNSTGEVTVEGWDRPGVEITTIRSTKQVYGAGSQEGARAARELDEVKVTVARQGEDVVVSTEYPRHRRFLPRPSVGARDFNLEYRIRAPRGAKIVVEHDEGEIHFDGVEGDISATTNQGTITLRLAAAAEYTIDAKSRIGAVDSDIPGTTRRKRFGHEFEQTAPAPHKLYLRNGFGDIIILRIHQPAPLS